MIFVNYKTNIIFFIGLAAVIGNVQALTCFQCDSETNANCSDSFRFFKDSGVLRVNCISPRENSLMYEDNFRSVCRKDVITEGVNRRVIRKCGYEANNVTERVDTYSTTSIHIYSCACQLCNTGNLAKSPSWIQAFIVTVLLSKLFM